MIDIKDFTALDATAKQALAALLSKNPAQEFWGLGKNDDLNLSFRIVKHFSSTKPERDVPKRIRFEVMANEVFAKGSYGTYYRSLFTLSLDNKGMLQIKQRTPGRLRLIKEQVITEQNPGRLALTKRRLQEENTAMQESSFFHCKPMVTVDNKVFMIMRELPGEELLEVINRNSLSIKERFQLTLALLQALHEQIHLKGRVHRDIKPENILVYRDGDRFIVYIIDYGFIKTIDYNDSLEFLGSKLYIAPECTMTMQKTPKTDIFALGKVLQFLWGNDNDNDINRVFYLMRERPACGEEIKSILKSMCAHSMSFRPEIPHLISLFNSLETRLDPLPIQQVVLYSASQSPLVSIHCSIC